MKLLILLIYLFLITVSISCSTLKSLFIVHRHGDRAPFVFSFYPNDPYKNESNWPKGFGQLTEKGEKRMFNIGLFLRNKYNQFLSNQIQEVRILSSDKKRCIDSALFTVSGMYQTNQNKCDENQLLKLVPIHTRIFNLDSLLNPLSFCPACDEEQNRIYAKKEVIEADNRNSIFYKYLIEKTGKKIKSFREVIGFQSLFDSQISNGFKLPDWLTSDVFKKIGDVRKKDFILKSSSRKLQRFKCGVFLNDLRTKIEKIIKNINLTAEDGYELGKVNLYSTHDYFISALLFSLKIFNGQIPPSGETIIFELHQQNNTHLIWDESSFIKVLLLNETNVDLSIDKLYLLKLPACNNTDFCSVRQFFTSVSDLILTPDEWIKECQIVPAKEFYFELLGLISIIVIILLFILILKKKRRF